MSDWPKPVDDYKGLRIQFRACLTLIDSLQHQLSYYQKTSIGEDVARLQLKVEDLERQVESERAVNERLTEELERCQ